MRQRTVLKIANCLLILTALLLLCLPAQAFIFQERIATSKALAHYAMGHMYDLLGLTNRAVLEYEKALQFDEASYLTHLRLGADYARLNMLYDAEAELKSVKKYNPDDLQSHYLLALIYSTKKEYDKAANEYEYILKTFSEAEPQNIEIYGYLGQLYYSQKKYEKAILQFERILEIEQNNADVLYLVSSLYIEVNDRKRAIELLEKSIAIDPEHDGSLNSLGYLYAETGSQLDYAKELIDRALAINPNNGAYLDSLGWVFYNQGLYEKALDLFIQADALLKDPVVYEHIGDAYYKLNDMDNALKYWELSLDLLPGQDSIIEKINDLKSIRASM